MLGPVASSLNVVLRCWWKSLLTSNCCKQRKVEEICSNFSAFRVFNFSKNERENKTYFAIKILYESFLKIITYVRLDIRLGNELQADRLTTQKFLTWGFRRESPWEIFKIKGEKIEKCIHSAVCRDIVCSPSIHKFNADKPMVIQCKILKILRNSLSLRVKELAWRYVYFPY